VAFAPAVLDQLAAEIGEDGIADLVRVFVEQSRSLIASARAQSGKAGRDEVIRAVHSIKSSAASVGAMALSALSAMLERQLKLGADAATPADFERLESALAAFLAAYDAARPAAPARSLVAA
jgi:HPt (histidine-containing phosphotransfer) domain-containing protein